MPELIKLDNPFRKHEREIIEIEPGLSVKEIIELKANGCDDDVLTYINGESVSKEQRETRIVKRDEYLLIVPKVAGDDDTGKTILNVALMVAVFAVAPYFAASLAYSMTAYVALKVAFIVGGAMLINALQPTPKKPSSGFIDDEQSQSFGWNPVTIQRQGIAIPRAYGLNRMYGNVIAAHTEKESETFSITTITETLYYWLYPTMGVWGPHGAIGSTTTTTTTKNVYDPRKVNLYALINLGIGPFREPVVSGTMRLNDELIENLQRVYYEERPGDIVQQPVSYFNQTKLEVVVNRLVSSDNSVVYTTTNANFNDIEVELAFNNGLFDASGGDLANYTVNVTVEIKKTTATAWIKLADNEAITDSVGDKVIQTYIASTEGFTVEYGYNYDIRVTKETADRDDIKYGDKLYLDKVREIISSQLTYPRMPLVGIKAQATDQLSGSIRFSCLSRGLYVRVYDGAAWNIEYSNNPAWVICDILTQPVYTGNHSPWIDLKLLLNFEGADAATETVDDSPKGHTITFGGDAQLDTAAFKFGAASGLLDGAGDYWQIANDIHSFEIFSNLIENWTLDLEIKMGDHAGTEAICGQYVDANNYWYLRHVDGAGLALYVYANATALIDISGIGEIADLNWHHIAICKIEDEIGIYEDETQIGYAQMASGAITYFDDSDFYIGQDGNGASYLYANVDHFRIIKTNIFSAAPVVGLTDTITEPAAAYTDPGNSYAVSRYDGYNPSKLLTADFEDLADWCDEAQINPINYGIENISQATNAVIITMSSNTFKVGDIILLRDVINNGMIEIADETTATIIKITDDTTFTIDIDTSGYSEFNLKVLVANFEGLDGDTTYIEESSYNDEATFAGNAQIDTAQSYFGSSSLVSSAVADYLYFHDYGQYDLCASNSDNWTVSFFYREDNLTNTADKCLVGQQGTGWEVERVGQYKIGFSCAGTAIDFETGNVLSNDTWHHIALCKVGNKYGIYVDGAQEGYQQSNDVNDVTRIMYINQWASGTNQWIDGLFISHGNYFNADPNAVPNDTITVPTSAPTGAPTIEIYQPRFAFNGIFDTDTTMWEAALSVCEQCRSILYFDGDKIRITTDKSGSSVYAFTVGNIIKDSFQQKFIPTAQRASEIEIHYRDRTKNYERTPFSLINSSLTNTTAKVRLDMFGITDTDMASRLAAFKLLQNLHIKQIAIWQAEIESIGITIGDIVDVQHDITNWGSIGSGDDPYTGGGRIVAATNTTNAVITIEGQIEFTDADFAGGSTTYALLIKPNTDAAPESKTITGLTESTKPGGTYDITVSGVYTSEPKKGDVWAAGIQNYETKKFRAINIRRAEDNKAEITGIEYVEAVYAND